MKRVHQSEGAHLLRNLFCTFAAAAAGHAFDALARWWAPRSRKRLPDTPFNRTHFSISSWGLVSPTGHSLASPRCGLDGQLPYTFQVQAHIRGTCRQWACCRLRARELKNVGKTMLHMGGGPAWALACASARGGGEGHGMVIEG